MFFLPKDAPYHYFPEVHLANEEGILAISEDLHPERVINAYYQGIFPWYNYDHTIIWWAPNPRFVLKLSELKYSKSLRPFLNQKKYKVTCNVAFEKVISNCRTAVRKDQEGTWITPKMKDTYLILHNAGFAHSIEVWDNDDLVGGLYGVQVGNMFCGESMFALKSNASKVGFVTLCKFLVDRGFEYVDCQNYTDYLASFGAKNIERKTFMEILEIAKKKDPQIKDWKTEFDLFLS